MKKKPENILDLFDENQKNRWFEHWTILYLPIIILILGLIFRIQHWPLSNILIASGLSAMMIRNFIFFFSKSRTSGEYAFLAGKVMLVTTLILHFGLKVFSTKLIFAGLLAFISGAAFYWLKRDNAKDDAPENIEDDF